MDRKLFPSDYIILPSPHINLSPNSSIHSQYSGGGEERNSALFKTSLEGSNVLCFRQQYGNSFVELLLKLLHTTILMTVELPSLGERSDPKKKYRSKTHQVILKNTDLLPEVIIRTYRAGWMAYEYHPTRKVYSSDVTESKTSEFSHFAAISACTPGGIKWLSGAERGSEASGSE